MKNTRTLAYAFEDVCSTTGMDLESWSFGDASTIIPNAGKGDLDVEHIMEWQSVTGFLDHLDKTENFCAAYKSTWKTTKLKTGTLSAQPGFEDLPAEGTFHQYVQKGFPSKQLHTEEIGQEKAKENSMGW